LAGLEENKHASKKRNAGRGVVGKTAVLGMRERGGRVVGKPVARTDKGTIQTTFSFRLNEGNVRHHTLTRLESFVGAVAGKRLTYKTLIQ
jgi:hypothetical protein